MDAARSLADLVEISPQVETALVLGADGAVAGAVGVPEARVGVLSGVVRELLDRAAAFRSGDGRVTQLHASLGDGEVFLVNGADGHVVAAVASGRPTPGLVFYDLKQCLARLRAGGTGGEPAGPQREDRPPKAAPDDEAG